MNINEEERRARLLKSRAERLPDIKKQFEEAQNRNFNSNFKPGGQDAGLVGSNGSTKGNAAKGVKNAPQGKNAKNSGKKTAKNGGKQAKKQANVPKAQAKAEAEKRKVYLSVSAKKGDMVHHQRMLSQDVNAQATQHIIGLPVNKSRYNGYGGEQITNAKLKQMRPDPEAVRIIPIGGVGEFGIGKNMTIIEYKSEIVVIDMGVLFAGDD